MAFYPMTWQKFLRRNGMHPDFPAQTRALAVASDDAAWLEITTLDPRYIQAYATHCRVSPEQVERLFRTFFADRDEIDQLARDAEEMPR
jgi:hypothetical protein